MKKRILLVDDDPRFRGALLFAAAELGSDVIQAANLKEASCELKVERFDLLIIDRNLPDGDGLNWLRTQRSCNIQTPALFISAFVDDSQSLHSIVKELGCCQVLQKPVSIDILHDTISLLLDLDKKDAFLNDEFASLAEDYKNELPEKLSLIAFLIRESNKFPHSPALLKEAAAQAHMLRGTAGTYGFAFIGDAMAIVEDKLRETLQHASFPIPKEALQDLENLATNVVKEALTALDASSRSNLRVLSKVSTLKKVIIIDEDKSYTQRLKVILSSESILVYAFQDCMFASSLVECLEPDLIITGDSTSSPTIPEFVCNIKMNSRFARIPVLELTDGNQLSQFADFVLSRSSNNTELAREIMSLLKYSCHKELLENSAA